MSMPSMEGEEGCYLKNNFLAHAAPLEAHHKWEEGTLLFFHSAKFCLGLSQQKEQHTSPCKIVQYNPAAQEECISSYIYIYRDK